MCLQTQSAAPMYECSWLSDLLYTSLQYEADDAERVCSPREISVTAGPQGCFAGQGLGVIVINWVGSICSSSNITCGIQFLCTHRWSCLPSVLPCKPYTHMLVSSKAFQAATVYLVVEQQGPLVSVTTPRLDLDYCISQ